MRLASVRLACGRAHDQTRSGARGGRPMQALMFRAVHALPVPQLLWGDGVLDRDVPVGWPAQRAAFLPLDNHLPHLHHWPPPLRLWYAVWRWSCCCLAIPSGLQCFCDIIHPLCTSG